jgi:hypothetical protein
MYSYEYTIKLRTKGSTLKNIGIIIAVVIGTEGRYNCIHRGIM